MQEIDVETLFSEPATRQHSGCGVKRSVIVTGRSVDRCIATLRAKLEKDVRNPTYIQTIRHIGYRFEPES